MFLALDHHLNYLRFCQRCISCQTKFSTARTGQDTSQSLASQAVPVDLCRFEFLSVAGSYTAPVRIKVQDCHDERCRTSIENVRKRAI